MYKFLDVAWCFGRPTYMIYLYDLNFQGNYFVESCKLKNLRTITAVCLCVVSVLLHKRMLCWNIRNQFGFH